MFWLGGGGGYINYYKQQKCDFSPFSERKINVNNVYDIRAVARGVQLNQLQINDILWLLRAEMYTYFLIYAHSTHT